MAIFKTIELDLVGATSQNRSRAFSSEVTKNFYIELCQEVT